jgi:hypothetical protein
MSYQGTESLMNQIIDGKIGIVLLQEANYR